MRLRGLDCHVAPMAPSWLTETVIANPMSGYPEYWQRRSSWFRAMSAAVIEVELEDGTREFGFCGGGKGSAIAAAVDEQLRSLVVGRDAGDLETLQEQLYRASIFYGRGGLTQAALSGIDLACWDARGEQAGVPVARLLAGEPARAARAVYYTGNDPAALAEFGIRDMKVAVPYGPAHGEEGMRANEAAVAQAREVLGADGFLSLNIYMAWSVSYTLRMVERLQKYRLNWIEEPVLPDDYASYAELRRRLAGSVRISGGEHEYTYAGFERLIGEGCVDLVQPDIYRAGGITGLRRIAGLAQRAGIQLICHGTGSATYHFLATLPPQTTPYAEFLDIYRGEAKTWVLTDDPRPPGGILTVPTAPGFGYDLNAAVFTPGAPSVATIW